MSHPAFRRLRHCLGTDETRPALHGYRIVPDKQHPKDILLIASDGHRMRVERVPLASVPANGTSKYDLRAGSISVDDHWRPIDDQGFSQCDDDRWRLVVSPAGKRLQLQVCRQDLIDKLGAYIEADEDEYLVKKAKWDRQCAAATTEKALSTFSRLDEPAQDHCQVHVQVTTTLDRWQCYLRIMDEVVADRSLTEPPAPETETKFTVAILGRYMLEALAQGRAAEATIQVPLSGFDPVGVDDVEWIMPRLAKRQR